MTWIDPALPLHGMVQWKKCPIVQYADARILIRAKVGQEVAASTLVHAFGQM
jgi:hypothetical protein